MTYRHGSLEQNWSKERDMAMRSEARLLILDNAAVGQLLQPEDVLHAVQEAFILHSKREGRVFPVVRESLNSGGIFGIKSGDVPAQDLLGFKAAGFWPANRQRGGEPHQATIMLFDPTTGRPCCLIDGNAITTARTGAAGGLGLDLFARADSHQLCIFGSGVQARIQLTYALRLRPNLNQVFYLTSNNNPDASFEQQFAGRCSLQHTTHANDAVAISDVIITATPGGGPLFDAEAVRPGTHLNCVGADTRGKRELPEGLLSIAKVYVDDEKQARQIGETQWAEKVSCTEIGDVMLKQQPAHRKPEDITIFDMTGLALQDLTVARVIQYRAQENSLGTQLPWPW
ncbi:Hypothetical protein ABZS17G119_04282 (plasmid) [Kosakonia cowanii]